MNPETEGNKNSIINVFFRYNFTNTTYPFWGLLFIDQKVMHTAQMYEWRKYVLWVSR